MNKEWSREPICNFQSQFSISKTIRIYLKNTNLGAHFLSLTSFRNVLNILFSKILTAIWDFQGFKSSKKNSFRGNCSRKCCGFLAKDLSNFVSLPWKLDNPNCHYVGIVLYYNTILQCAFIENETLTSRASEGWFHARDFHPKKILPSKCVLMFISLIRNRCAK